jgi:hypothetical protein
VSHVPVAQNKLINWCYQAQNIRWFPQYFPFPPNYCQSSLTRTPLNEIPTIFLTFVRFEAFTAMTMKNAIFWNLKTQFVPHRKYYISATEPSWLMLCKIWGLRDCEYEELLVTANVVLACWLFSPWWWMQYFPPKGRFLQESPRRWHSSFWYLFKYIDAWRTHDVRISPTYNFLYRRFQFEVYRSFGGTCYFHPQDWSKEQTWRNPQPLNWKWHM